MNVPEPEYSLFTTTMLVMEIDTETEVLMGRGYMINQTGGEKTQFPLCEIKIESTRFIERLLSITGVNRKQFENRTSP